jgi:glycosyltransferase involved in cell wall biosynthesis
MFSNTTKTVVIVIHAPQWGGLHALVERIAPFLRIANWRATVVLPLGKDNGATRFRAAGIRTIEIPLRRIRKSANPLTQIGFLLSILPDIFRLRRILRDEQADVVQICGLLHFHAAIAARILRVPLVWQLHSDLAPMALRRLFMPLILRLAHVIMTSGEGLERSHPGASRFGKRLVPFYAPVDAAAFRPDAGSRRAMRLRLGLSDDQIVIGTVGNRGRQKNHEMFVRVADRLFQKYGDRVRFLICGSDVPSNREYYDRAVIALATRLNLIEDGRLRFITPHDEVAAYYNAMDIFLLTSHAEGASLVTMEAMATALPTVVTDVGSLRDSVTDNVSGYVTRPNDDTGMAAVTAKLVDSQDTREAMASAALARAREFFTVEHCAKAHLRAYGLAIDEADRRANAD